MPEPGVGSFPVLIRPGGRIAANDRVHDPPSRHVIDQNGTVAVRIIGAVTAAPLDSVVSRTKAKGV